MASITRRPNGQWRARVPVGHGRQVAKHFPRKVDAQRWAAIEEAKLARGEWLDPRTSRLTVREYGETWRASRSVRTSTAAQYESHLRIHVYPVLGDRPLVALRPSELSAWVRGLTDTLAPATAETVARILGSIFRSAVLDRLITVSPMAGVRVPSPQREMVTPLTPEQVAALMDAVPPRLRALVAVGAGCGLRVSEAVALSPSSVDFLRHTVRVDRQLGAGGVVGPPKTRTSVRVVPLPDPVAWELSAHLERWPAVDVPGTGELVFTSAAGRPLNRSRVGDALRIAVPRAGLPAGTTFHDLRHHCASLLIAAGLSVKAVQSILGHATAAETLDTYGHLWPAEGAAMRGAIERAWRAGPISATG